MSVLITLKRCIDGWCLTVLSMNKLCGRLTLRENRWQYRVFHWRCCIQMIIVEKPFLFRVVLYCYAKCKTALGASGYNKYSRHLRFRKLLLQISKILRQDAKTTVSPSAPGLGSTGSRFPQPASSL